MLIGLTALYSPPRNDSIIKIHLFCKHFNIKKATGNSGGLAKSKDAQIPLAGIGKNNDDSFAFAFGTF